MIAKKIIVKTACEILDKREEDMLLYSTSNAMRRSQKMDEYVRPKE